MDVNEVNELVEIFRDAKISELTVKVGDSTVRLRKPLVIARAASEPPVVERAEPAAASPVVEAAEPQVAECWITAPMVGVFHNAGKSVAVGEAVKVGQVVGAIESMKLMNEVVSESEGVIAEIGVEDGMAVEYGQRLFRLSEAQ